MSRHSSTSSPASESISSYFASQRSVVPHPALVDLQDPLLGFSQIAGPASLGQESAGLSAPGLGLSDTRPFELLLEGRHDALAQSLVLGHSLGGPAEHVPDRSSPVRDPGLPANAGPTPFSVAHREAESTRPGKPTPAWGGTISCIR